MCVKGLWDLLLQIVCLLEVMFTKQSDSGVPDFLSSELFQCLEVSLERLVPTHDFSCDVCVIESHEDVVH